MKCSYTKIVSIFFSPSPNTTGYQTRSPAPGQMTPGMPRPNNPNQSGLPNHGNFGQTNMNQKMGNQMAGNNMGFPQNPGMTQPNVASQHINNMVGNLNQPYGNPMGNNPNNRMISGMNQPGIRPGMMGPGGMMPGPGMNPNQMRAPFMQNPMPGQPPMGGNMQPIMGNRPMNQPPGNQFNQNPGGPGPGPNQNQVINPNQPGQPNQTGNNNGIGPPLANATDPDKRKMIQNQLIILIHAAKCQKRADNQDGQVSFYYIISRFRYEFKLFSNNNVKYHIVRR